MKYLFAAIYLLFLSLIPILSLAECSEIFTIDSTEYKIPDWWCERKIDSVDLAEPSDLVRLPERLCHKDYKIYVSVETRDNLVRMADSAMADSVHLSVKSGFRSLWYQKRLIKNRLDRILLIEDILRVVAPPGYSEHHTGRAVDFVNDTVFFGRSREYEWLKENAGSFGFIESFPKDSTNTMHWEPWHWYYHKVVKDSLK